jgi:hypothetical protein
MVEGNGLAGEQGEIVRASRWLDDEERLLLALWWQEAAGTVTRAGLADALRQPPAALARSITRLAGTLQDTRVVERVLRHGPGCRGLAATADGWDGHPAPGWRDRLAAHVLNCRVCLPGRVDLSPAEWLFQGLALVPPPPSLARSALSSAPGDDQRPAGTRGPQRPAAGHRPPAARPALSRLTGGRVRWTRTSLVAASSGLALCVLVATIAIVRAGGPSPTAASAAGASGAPGATAPAHGTSGHGASAGGAPGSGPAASSAPAAAGAPAGHKGVGVVAGTGVNTALAASGASWYYNWAATPNGISTPSGTAFVPMIKLPTDANTATLNQVKQEGKYLLGFNEPDVANEANLTVAQALALWPKLEATGMQLGSPAISYGTNKTTSWLGQFMQGARTRGYRVNFITVHWYGQHHWTSPATNVSNLKAYLQQTYDIYHLPIWITEFSLISFQTGKPVYPTGAQQAAFLTAATQMLAGLPFVQRYAWYTLAGTHNGGTTVLFSDGASPSQTAVGRAFKEVP